MEQSSTTSVGTSTSQPQQYPEELERAWEALRDFCKGIIKDIEIEQRVKERLQRGEKGHDSSKEPTLS